MKPIGQWKGAGLWMRYEEPAVVVVRWRMGRGRPDQDDNDALAIHGLVHALGGAGTIRRTDDGWMEAEVVYDDELDAHLVELIDLLVGLRYSHPRMVQLPLDLTDSEAEKLAEVMGE